MSTPTMSPSLRRMQSSSYASADFIRIENLKAFQRLRKRLFVELRVCPRPRHFSDVLNENNISLAQRSNERLKAPVGMVDGEEWKRHVRRFYLRVRLRALPLWAAMWSVLSLLISYWGSSSEA